MSPARKKAAYAQAGVDIDLGNRVKATLPELLASTHRPEVLGKVGGFGGLFALNVRRYRQPVLVSSVDGVGTKLKIAFALGRHDTVGQDLVNHCVNDIVVLGAEPLFFLDYLGTGKLEPHVFTEVIRGFAQACSENGCALIGGETAQMPGFYQAGEYDLSGSIVGVVEQRSMLDGPRSVVPGDQIIGWASSGLHTNGYSLARRICFDTLKLKPRTRVRALGTSVGEELLKIHRSYSPMVLSLLRRFNRSLPLRKRPIKALAHITGGGFIDNLPRVLPDGCDAIFQKGAWPIPPVFEWLQREGSLDESEMYQVFNMGIGMVALVQPAQVHTILRTSRRLGHEGWHLGEITQGSRKVRFRG